LPEKPDKAVVIVGVVENPGAVIAPVQGMVTISAEISAGDTWHAGIVPPIGEHGKVFFPGTSAPPCFRSLDSSGFHGYFWKRTLNVPVTVPVTPFVASDLAGDLAEKRIEQAISLYNQIKETAYFIWLQEGCPHGRDVEHWQRAIEQLKRELKACYGKTRSLGNGS
jgi:hypothetical protein